MHRPDATSARDREALCGGVRYHFFVTDLPYHAFVTTYLLGEAPGVSPEVIYDRYVALGGNPSYIRDQRYLLIQASGNLDAGVQ